jgi:hypothetical protein
MRTSSLGIVRNEMLALIGFSCRISKYTIEELQMRRRKEKPENETEKKKSTL